MEKVAFPRLKKATDTVRQTAKDTRRKAAEEGRKVRDRVGRVLVDDHDSGPKSSTMKVEADIARAFTPQMPIQEPEFFAGRKRQVRLLVDAITTTGLHAIVHGPRGVGKTSLTTILPEAFGPAVVSHVDCGRDDTFAAVARRALRRMELYAERTRPGFKSGTDEVRVPLDRMFIPDDASSPDALAAIIAQLPPYAVFVIDEFDLLPPEVKAAFAHLAKAMSDRRSVATLVLVGIAEDVNELMEEHESVQRCMREIKLSPMTDEEVQQILDRGFRLIGLPVADRTILRRIIRISQGFPYYTHLLGKHTARAALDQSAGGIRVQHLDSGMSSALDEAEHWHTELYHRAVTGVRNDRSWISIVAACAVAKTDERGYFSLHSVVEALARVAPGNASQPRVASYLSKLTSESRGPLLERRGDKGRYRYRFVRPLLRPYVVLHGINEGLIPIDVIAGD